MYKKSFYVDYHHKEETKRDGMNKYRLQETSLGGHGQVVLWRRMDFTCISAMDINDYESVTIW